MWRFEDLSQKGFVLTEGSYDYSVVMFSLIIAATAAFAMLMIVERLWRDNADSDHSHNKGAAWLALASGTMGLGVWSMHFTGMYAFQLPYHMHMSVVITIISVLPACIGAYFALKLYAARRFDLRSMQVGALCLTLGIGAMHYLGMEAMHYEGLVLRYDPTWFVLSIVMAYIFALLALYVRVWQNNKTSSTTLKRLVASVLIGLSVSGMHYTAMLATEFYLDPSIVIPDHSYHEHTLLSWIVIVDVLLFLTALIIVFMLGTKLDQAQKAAMASEQRENAVISALADALLVLDSDGNVTTYNVSAQRLFGAQHRPLEQKHIVQLMPEIGSFEELQDWEHSNLAKGVSGLTLEFSTYNGDGPRYYEAVFSRLYFDESIHYVSMIRDITVRMQMEQKLRQAQKLESIGQLAAGIAHEINTPIQYVSDNMSFLKKAVGHVMQATEMYRQVVANCCDDNSKEQVQELEKMLKKAKFAFIREEIPKSIDQSAEGLGRVTKIVRAMKSFSHASDGEFSQVDLLEALESTITICRNEWKYVADLDLDVDSHVGPISLILDEFNQVILNLVVNSAHAIEERRVKENSAELGRILVSAKTEGKILTLKVTDNGCGISKENQEKVFEPFFTTKVVGKGTGQGLNIVYSVIVEKHRGSIDIKSKEGEGTTFILTLPTTQDGQESET
ncbi:MAG: ATP-binding protein [Oleiphilaceae bacterium]|nr:ATP-binding protein [Oleiphilaceae bacterium]